MKSDNEKMSALKGRPVYLESGLHGMAFRTEPGEKTKWFAKLPGGAEFPTKYSAETATDAYLEWAEISPEKYARY